MKNFNLNLKLSLICFFISGCNVPDLNLNTNLPTVNPAQPTSNSLHLTATNSPALNSFTDGAFASVNSIGIKIPKLLHVSVGNTKAITATLQFEKATCSYSNHQLMIVRPVILNETEAEVQIKPDEEPINLIPENQQIYLDSCSDSSISDSSLTVYQIGLHIESSGSSDAKVEANIEKID